MENAVGSSTRPTGPLEGDWKSCSVTQGQLNRLSTSGYLPEPEFTQIRPGLVTLDGGVLHDNFPTPQGNERVCFVPFLLRSLGFPIHPFLRGLLHFYGIQLHHLSPNSILHIACFVTLCETFLGCEAHFDLWCKYFCLVPCSRDGNLFECGGAEVCRIAGSGYLIGTPKEDIETWQGEWFYISDVPLEGPPRQGLPPFSLTPPTKRYNWRPRTQSRDGGSVVARLAAQVTCLAHNKLTLINVMAVAIARGIQPLQQRVHPMWEYNGTDDSTRAIRCGFEDRQALGLALETMFKGEKADLIKEPMYDGFSCYKPIEAVSCFIRGFIFLNKVYIFLISFSTYLNRAGKGGLRRWILPLLNRSSIPAKTTSACPRTPIPTSSSEMGSFIRRVLMAPKWPSYLIAWECRLLPLTQLASRRPPSRKRSLSSTAPSAFARAPSNRGRRSKRSKQASTQEGNGPRRNPGPVIGQAIAEEQVPGPPSSAQ